MESSGTTCALAVAAAAPLRFVALVVFVGCAVPPRAAETPLPLSASASDPSPTVLAGATSAPSAEAPSAAGSSAASLLAPLPDAPCRIALGQGRVDRLPLSWRGATFASFAKVETAELRIDASGTRATLGISTTELELVGEIDPLTVRVFPHSDALVDGYFRVDDARLERLSAEEPSRAVVYLRSTSMVRPLRAQELSWPCEQLALGRRPRKASAGKLSGLRLDADTPLSVTPGGDTIAMFHPQEPTWQLERLPSKPRRGAKGIVELARRKRVESPAVIGLRVFELQRAAGSVKIRLVEGASVSEVWVPPTAIQAARWRGQDEDPEERPIDGRSDATICDRAVPIFLRQADFVVEVGRYKPGAHIVAPDKDVEARPGERTIVLPGGIGSFGAGARPPTRTSGRDGEPPPAGPPRPFVRLEALEGCRSFAGDATQMFGRRRGR